MACHLFSMRKNEELHGTRFHTSLKAQKIPMGRRRDYCAMQDLEMENCNFFILAFIYRLHHCLMLLMHITV